MPVLQVPDAQLYYETRGLGPVLVMVPGANGTLEAFQAVGEYLASDFTVVTYDRRGFSRSKRGDPSDNNYRLDKDADDLRRLIEHVSDKPAVLFGSSSGGVVVLETFNRYPSVIKTLIPHEPAAMALLPDGREWINFLSEIYDLYRQTGLEKALNEFSRKTFSSSDHESMSRVTDPDVPEMSANNIYWFEHELRQYTSHSIDVNNLKKHRDQILLVGGQESHGYPTYRVNEMLAKSLNKSVVDLPGGHVGYMAQPKEFAEALLRAIQAHK